MAQTKEEYDKYIKWVTSLPEDQQEFLAWNWIMQNMERPDDNYNMHQAQNIPLHVFAASIAVSLKRIADHLEKQGGKQ